MLCSRYRPCWHRWKFLGRKWSRRRRESRVPVSPHSLPLSCCFWSPGHHLKRREHPGENQDPELRRHRPEGVNAPGWVRRAAHSSGPVGARHLLGIICDGASLCEMRRVQVAARAQMGGREVTCHGHSANRIFSCPQRRQFPRSLSFAGPAVHLHPLWGCPPTCVPPRQWQLTCIEDSLCADTVSPSPCRYHVMGFH